MWSRGTGQALMKAFFISLYTYMSYMRTYVYVYAYVYCYTARMKSNVMKRSSVYYLTLHQTGRQAGQDK